ncbi:unnamed protein product [Brachionus calyciflorus]|uniref:Uncharacterized protein n=1 Tax=Brachionus calyciflorus TaxID=104777 RepID=A0A813RDQ1_9BILA|nr:unnamed protein product [Brachionus calyciflorus]
MNLLIFINLIHFVISKQSNICDVFKEDEAYCLIKQSKGFLADEEKSIELVLRRISNVPSQTFANLNITILNIADSSLQYVSTDAFENVLRIDSIFFENVVNLDRLLAGNNSFFLFGKIRSIIIKQNKNINSNNINYYLRIIDKLSVQDVGLYRINLENCSLDFREISNIKYFGLEGSIVRNIKVLLGEQLIRLTLGFNEIKIIEMSLSKSTLSYLDLGGNFLENFIAPNISNLTHLRLESNLIKRITPEMFENLINLENLYLENNLISIIDENSFKNLNQLKNLYLRDNLLDEKNPKIFFNTLNVLELSRNKFKIFNSSLAFEIGDLKVLDLSGNMIESFYINMKNLVKLDLSYNRLVQFDQAHLINITEILIIKNNLNLSQLDLGSIENIQSLILNLNEIKQVDSDQLNQFFRVQRLDISFNSIESINFPILSLKELILSFNKLAVISSKNFENLHKLETLILNYNQINFIERNSFINLKNLKYLYLSGNYLFVLPNMNEFKSIEHISLRFQHGRLNYIDNSLFGLDISRNNSNFNVDLTNNNITSVYPHLFCSKNVKNILINFDHLKPIDKCMLKQISNLNWTLQINTPVSCELKKMAKKMNISFLDERDNTECINYNLIDDCSELYKLKFNCSFNLSDFARRIVWIINFHVLSFKSIQTYNCTLDSIPKKCIENMYFSIYCFSSNGQLRITFNFLDKKKNFEIKEYSDGSTLVYHNLTKTIIFVLKTNETYELIVSSLNYLYLKSSGILIDACHEDKFSHRNKLVENFTNKTTNLMSFIYENTYYIDSDSFNFSTVNNFMKHLTIKNNQINLVYNSSKEKQISFSIIQFLICIYFILIK